MAEGDIDPIMLEVGQALSKIADELDDADRQKLTRMIEATSMPGRTYETLISVIREFTMMVARYTNISVELVKIAIRAFLAKGFTSLPTEIENSDDVFIRSYYKALLKGQRKVTDIRLMVVGMFGVGKTSLVQNLVEDDDSEEINGETVTNINSKIESTVGIDVRQCLVKQDCKWVQTYFGHTANDRLKEVYVPSADVTDSGQTTDTTLLYSRTERFEESKHDTLSLNMNEEELSAFKEKLVLNEDPKFKMLMLEIFRTKDLSESYQLEPMVSLWDFAGQYIYYSTHHFFLNSRSIYLLLMDVSKPLDSMVKETADFPLSGFLHREFTCHEAFKFWLSSIHMYSSQQFQRTEIQPCVILVGTHKDILEVNEDEKERYMEDYFNKALKCFEGTPVIKHVHRRKFLVNNLASSETFEEIKMEVFKLAKNHTFWEEVRPAKWLPLQRSLEVFKEKGKEIISFHDLQTADRQNESSIENVDELKIFLHFQHSLGNILFYDTKLLKNIIILSPQWIVDAFRCFVTHVRDKDPKQLHLWTDFETKAMLTPELIDEIIDRNPKNQCFRDYKKEIIEYMEHLDMIAKPTLSPIKVETFESSVNSETNADQTDIEIDYVGMTPVTEQGPVFSDISQNTVCKAKANEQQFTYTPVQELSDAVPSEFYIVPSLLKSRPDNELMSKLINPVAAVKKTPVLCLKFNDGFMPPSVFHRLIAVCIKRWHTVKLKDQDLLFNGLAVFRITNTASNLTIWFHDNVIFARVAVYSEDKSTPFVEVRKFLIQTLNDILSILPKGVMPFEEYIQCPRMEEFDPNYGLLKVNSFLYERVVMCDHDLHAAVEKKDALGLWYGDFISNQVTSSLSDTDLQRKPTERELGRVSRCIGDEYFRLGLELNLSPQIIQHIRMDYKWYTPTIIFHILYEWMRNGTDVSVKTLRNAMIMVQSDVKQFDEILLGSLEQESKLDYSRSIDFGQVPTETDIIEMTNMIGDEVWLLGIELLIPEITMQQLKMDSSNTSYLIRNMLRKWKSMENIVCNIGVLARAVRLVGGDMDKFYEVFQNK